MNDKMKPANEDYLWDQTGEPDAEIQELERVLGTHRYQPRPLAIPEMPQFETSPRRNFQPFLAIAATIILAVGAVALWRGFSSDFGFGFARHETPEVAKNTTNATNAPQPAASVDSANPATRAAATIPTDVLSEVPSVGSAETPEVVKPATPSATNSTASNRQLTPRRNRPGPGVNPSRSRSVEPQRPVLAANELKEAEEGKAKLMLALRVASEKLNFALRKAQGSGNQIHNQHKIG
jgi:hypothetical protein